MPADALATLGASASTGMILTSKAGIFVSSIRRVQMGLELTMSVRDTDLLLQTLLVHYFMFNGLTIS